MEIFGCCSSYVECSDALKCLHEDDVIYRGCQYKINLFQGRIFYGKNAFKFKKIKPKQDYNIYLYCYKRLFSVKSRNKNTYSYNLNSTQFESIKEKFQELEIPFKLELVEDECFLDSPERLNPEPANSRVVITINNEEFNILNYNSYLIKSNYAEKISTAFNLKGLESRIELLGKYSNEVRINHNTEYIKTSKPEKAEDKKTEYVQMSIFNSLPILRKAVGG